MATFFFDGTKDLTVTKSDVVVVTGGAASFAGASFGVFGAGATATFGAFKVTVSDAPNVEELNKVLSVPGGSVSINTGAAVAPAPGNNALASSLKDATPHSFTGDAASQVSVIFGGSGVSDSADLGDSISIGGAGAGKGTFTVYGNGGADSIQSTAALDSSAVVTVYGGAGADLINLTGAKSAITVYGNSDAGKDSITVDNTGTTTIYGGSGVNDSVDSADEITIGGAVAGGGTYTVYGNGGDDKIVTAAGGLDSTGTATVYGGAGADTVTLTGAKSTITVYGGGDSAADTIKVTNTGTTTIYGGTGVNDSADGADTINFGGGGTFTVYGNGGDDTIALTAPGKLDSTTVATVYGGAGKDGITIDNTAGGATKLTVYGNNDDDTIAVTTVAKSTTTIYGGSGFSDSADKADTITINGNGTFTVYGNGGDDTINVKVGSASGETTSVFGGAGKDTISLETVTKQNETAFTLSGGDGADTFAIVKGSGAQVTVSDYTSADKMTIKTGTAAAVSAVASSATTLQAALDAAATGADKTAQIVAFQGNSYVVVNDGVAGFDATKDMAIKLTGVTDALSVAATITTVL